MVTVQSHWPPVQLGSWKVVVLHPPHPIVDALVAQLDRLGIAATVRWPALHEDDRNANAIIFDADLGHDGQFPWADGEAPMPLIAVIGSEAPGRIGWTLLHGADAHLLKPIGSSGVFSALLIAAHAFDAKQRAAQEIRALKERLAKRGQVVRATLALMQAEGLDEAQATRRLRTLAMDTRRTVEDMADEILRQSRHPAAAHSRQRP